jgi:hypothetical protein
MIYIPNFIKIGSGAEKLISGYTDRKVIIEEDKLLQFNTDI